MTHFKKAIKRYCPAHQDFWVEFAAANAKHTKSAVEKVCRVCSAVFPCWKDPKQMDLDLPSGTIH